MKPVSQKPIKQPKDPAYLAKVAKLPCCACEADGVTQTSPTQVHHPICGRYGTLKAPDPDAIPLCEGHHLGFRDKTKLAIHDDKKLWSEKYGPDTDFIEAARSRVDMLDYLDTC